MDTDSTSYILVFLYHILIFTSSNIYHSTYQLIGTLKTFVE